MSHVGIGHGMESKDTCHVSFLQNSKFFIHTTVLSGNRISPRTCCHTQYSCNFWMDNKK